MSKSDDYFGGSKKRKVESIDEEIEVNSDSSDASPSEKETAKSGNWDFLSNMLGLSGKKKEPTPAPATEKPESIQPKREPAATVKTQPKKHDSPKANRSSQPIIKEDLIAEDPIKALEEVANAPAEDKADILTQIFSAGFGDSKKKEAVADSSDSFVADASDSDSDSGDDQPAKKQSRSRGRSRRGKKPRQETAEAIAEEAEVVEDVEDAVTADDDFVEFEIEELDNTPINDDEADSRGRSRRRRRGRSSGGDSEKDNRGSRKRSAASESRRKKPKPEFDDSFDDPIDSGDVDPRDVDPRDEDSDDTGRGSRRSRGNKRSRGGRGRSNEGSARDDRGPQDSGHDRDRDEQSEGQSRRRRGRSSGRDRDRDDRSRDDEPSRVSADRGSNHGPDRGSDRGSSKRNSSRKRGPRRDWDRETSDDDSVDDSVRSASKGIPTWKDAIGAMIEANTKSHSSRPSRSGSPRGGRSRSGGGSGGSNSGGGRSRSGGGGGGSNDSGGDDRPRGSRGGRGRGRGRN